MVRPTASKARRFVAIRAGLGVLFTFMFVAAYFVLAGLLGVLSANSDYRPAETGVDLYIRGNGVHVDLVVPLMAAGIDWRQRLGLAPIASALTPTADLAFGWGDRGLYLETPTWADLKTATALAALSGLDRSVMHVEVVAIPFLDDETRHMRVSNEDYRRLAAFIETSFKRDRQGRAIDVRGAHYGAYDMFFEAEGRYSLFKTCNEWTRQGLETAGVRVPLWAPFEWALLYQVLRDD